MSKKTWILISCLVLSLSLGLGGSLAYLTDTDTEVNTFTMGNVDIDVEENFPNSELKPGVDVIKEAKIINKGNNPAYVWMTVAVPADMDEYITLGWPEPDVEGAEPVADFCRLPFTPDGKLDMSGESDGVRMYYTARGEDEKDYHVYSILWWPVLETEAPNNATDNLLLSVTLSEYVDVVDGNYYYIKGGEKTQIPNPNDMKIIVTGHAIQADGFDDAVEAYKAYGVQWGELVVKTEDSNNDNSSNWETLEPTVYTADAEVEAIIELNDDDPDATDCVVASGDGVVVTITDGRYNIGNNYGPCAVWAKDGATVKIMSGEFKCKARTDLDSDTHIDLIYAGSGAEKTYGTIEIYGGYFFAEGSTPENPGAWLLNENDTYGTIIVKGGTFGNWNPADNDSEGAHTNFVAEGYSVWKETTEHGWEWYHVGQGEAPDSSWVKVH